ncbi:hypothetical protein HBH70_231250 [Parastagonospora nodorum]|nr:hypothetical protein HBH53_237160 [Parastagonospora nodorum]KAH3964311.1 hypothetical protein HBH52_212530 [Parastagonospora nodorum]KAH4044017.1 hypothetical protein HBH49_224240 [Parastagonospora nodorum]KAH4061482.1 hypothetical protein HBH50_221440 [Parastagonospora nodorum]KAH4079927.1 hypothetical protein HBH48_214930 [Parastagonospora nodorum]
MLPYITPAPDACVFSFSTDLNNALPRLQTPSPPKSKPPHNRIPPTRFPRHNPTPALPNRHQLLTRRLGTHEFVRDVERVGGEVHVLTPTRYQASEGEAVERGNERAVRQNQKIGEQWGYTWGRVGLKV